MNKYFFFKLLHKQGYFYCNFLSTKCKKKKNGDWRECLLLELKSLVALITVLGVSYTEVKNIRGCHKIFLKWKLQPCNIFFFYIPFPKIIIIFYISVKTSLCAANCVNLKFFKFFPGHREYKCVRSTDDCKIESKTRRSCKKCRYR